MNTKKVVLVTGSSGLIGNAFKKIASDYDYDFVFSNSSECNLTNYSDTLNHFQKINPNYVIHLAGQVGGLYKNMNFKVNMLEQNLLMNFNVVKICHEIKVEKCICILSTCIFPDKTTYPIDESMLHNGPPHFSNDAYAHAKRMMEIHCRAYNEQYKTTNFSCIIPTNVYGPHDNYSLEDGHVLPSLIHKCYLAKKNNIPFEVRGSGKPLRQFIYSEDLAKLIMQSMVHLSYESLIIAPEEEYSIGEIAEMIAKEFDYDKLVYNTEFSDGQFKKTANNDKMKKMNPDFVFCKIQEGIKNSVDFFKENYEICRK